jgi:hypothetical protein
MPLRFTRRIRLMPGLRPNLSKSGASISVGHKGACNARRIDQEGATGLTSITSSAEESPCTYRTKV